MIEQPNSVADNIRTVIFWIGMLLIIAGVIALLGLVTVAVDIVNNPEEVQLVQWLAGKVGESELFLRGHFDQTQFEIEASPALQYIALGIIGLLLMNILAAIVRSLITVGAQLIQFAGIQRPDKPSSNR
ncbi:MAG: hypothetical protein D3910_24665 [Candidatus Electrothrix sp. ATG2]|nr:hypothetical protein [Candidatus Electrothrix sp. ATG2]